MSQSRRQAPVLDAGCAMWKWLKSLKSLKSRLWDVEAIVWGAPGFHGVHDKVPWLRRLARLLRRESEIAVVALLLILLTIYVFWP
jgi:hypothetical protein